MTLALVPGQARPAAAASRAAWPDAHRPARNFVLCKPFSRRTIRGPWGSYIIRDDVFWTGRGNWRARICLHHSGGVPSFTISRSNARELPGYQPNGYPEILYGCVYGACSPGSFLPQRVRRVRNLRVSVYDRLTRPARPGRWDASLDIWFSRRDRFTGQAQGAELMIWMTNRGVIFLPTWSIRVGHVTWLAEEWRVYRLSGASWPLIIFERARPDGHVRRLSLLPFFRAAERHGWLRPSYWLESIAAGLEIWNHGAGLGIEWMRVFP